MDRRANSIKETLEQKVAAMSREEAWAYWLEVRKAISENELVKKALYSRFADELGDSEKLEMADGEGFKWQTRTSYSVSLPDVEDAVPDRDKQSMFLKVDWKKAKEVLDAEEYRALESRRQVEKATKALITGKV